MIYLIVSIWVWGRLRLSLVLKAASEALWVPDELI